MLQRNMISVIIPIYNGEKFIAKTVEAVLAQDYQNFEIVLSDDNSTDNSRDEIQKLAQKDERIIVRYNKVNKGLMKNDNESAKLARGEYLLFLGQDDIIQQGHLSKMISCFDSNTVAVFCDYSLINESDIVFDEGDHCVHRDLLYKDFIIRNPVPSCGLIVKAKAFLEVGGFQESEKYKNFGEYDLWVRLQMRGKFKFCHIVRAYYRRHSSNITNSFQDYRIRRMVNEYMNKSRLLLLDDSRLTLVEKVELLLCYLLRKGYDIYLLIRAKSMKQ